jgi:hypothetical protein
MYWGFYFLSSHHFHLQFDMAAHLRFSVAGTTAAHVTFAAPPIPFSLPRSAAQYQPPRIPALCRDPNHAISQQSVVGCNDPLHVSPFCLDPAHINPPLCSDPTHLGLCRDPDHLRSPIYLARPSTHPQMVTPILSLVYPPGKSYAWAEMPSNDFAHMITELQAPIPAPEPAVPIVSDSLPLLSVVPTHGNLIFLCFGVMQDFTFRVTPEFTIDYVERGPTGIHAKYHATPNITPISAHANHHHRTLFRITFLRTTV